MIGVVLILDPCAAQSRLHDADAMQLFLVWYDAISRPSNPRDMEWNTETVDCFWFVEMALSVRENVYSDRLNAEAVMHSFVTS